MAKTYIPTSVKNIHELAIFLTRYNSVLRAAIATISPDDVAIYDTMFNAVIAFDALRGVLYPIEP